MKRNPVGRKDIFVDDTGQVTRARGRSLIRPESDSDGVLFVTLDDGSKHAIHELVWSAFKGDPPPGYMVVHHDGDWTNNRLGNLEIVPFSDASPLFADPADPEGHIVRDGFIEDHVDENPVNPAPGSMFVDTDTKVLYMFKDGKWEAVPEDLYVLSSDGAINWLGDPYLPGDPNGDVTLPTRVQIPSDGPIIHSVDVDSEDGVITTVESGWDDELYIMAERMPDLTIAGVDPGDPDGDTTIFMKIQPDESITRELLPDEFVEASMMGRWDDLTQIKGLGPRAMDVLNDADYWVFDDLATASPETLRAVFERAGKKPPKSIDNWPAEAAALAAAADAPEENTL